MERVGCDVVCKGHSARSERDQFRICPTKLTKQELENLYFALLENNLELKKTVNVQRDKIKVLTTRVQRISSTHKVICGDGKKDCCVSSKAVFNQQKDMITELKHTNDQMAERIRKLNMRLCSAKQFYKSATPRCLRCSSTTSPYLIKQSPPSYKQQSQSTIKLALSCHNLSRDSMVPKSVQTDSFYMSKDKSDKKVCEDNKCRTAMDELEQKIVNLQEEISRIQEDCTFRINTTQAELSEARAELSEARAELVRARAERLALEQDVLQRDNRHQEVVACLRAAQGQTGELKMQLSIEKRKLAELETRLKTSAKSNRVTQSIEDTLNSIQVSNKAVADVGCACSPRCHSSELSVQQTYNDDTKISRSVDDSGYLDASKSQSIMDDQTLNKIIEDLTKRILVLQTQVDEMTIAPPVAEVAESSTSTDDHTKILTSVEHVISHKNTKTPPKISPQQSKDVTDDLKPNLVDITTNDNVNSIETNKNSNNAVDFNTKQTAWKSTKNKLTAVSKITKEKDEKENKDKSKDIKDVNDKDNANTANKIEAVEALSSSSDEGNKTYNVSQDNEINIKIPETNTKKTVKDKEKVKKDKDLKREKKILVKNKSNEKVFDRNEVRSPSKVTGRKDKHNANDKRYIGVDMALMLSNIKQKAQGARRKTLAKAEKQNISTCEEQTYTVEYEDDSRPSSPDNTDYEISSMTDLPDEREAKSPPKYCLSPGERKFPSTVTNTVTSPFTNYSLSEGEIPTATVRRKSNGDKPSNSNVTKESQPKMEETLQAITDELERCKRLLFSSRSQEY